MSQPGLSGMLSPIRSKIGASIHNGAFTVT
jgi:hypothetical protein